jgi:hypothetical protein
MDERTILGTVLGLAGTPWRMEAVTLNGARKQLTIRLGFERGSRFFPAAEALNSLIQTAKRKSRGFRSSRHFRAIIFLLGGNLNLNLPDPVPPPPLYPQ